MIILIFEWVFNDSIPVNEFPKEIEVTLDFIALTREPDQKEYNIETIL